MGFYLLDRPTTRRSYYPTRRGTVLAAVVHITAGLQGLPSGADSSAERTARYAATTDRAVSWHSGSDGDSHLQLLPDSYTAFHVQGYNSRTIGHEISKRDTRWADEDPEWVRKTLEQAAASLRPRLVALGVPVRRATRAELDRAIAAGGRPVGLISHADLDPARRRDPGPDFPWQRFLALLAPQEDDTMETIGPGSDKATVALLQRCLINEARANGQPNPLPKYGADGLWSRDGETSQALDHYRARRGIWTSKPGLCGGVALALLLRYEYPASRPAA